MAKVKDEKGLPCISLIGMPGSGKSAIGALLARKLNWAYMDTDFLLEALYACKLQNIVDSLGKKEFLNAEERMILSIDACRSVIATGGSAVYREKAMVRLREMGPVVYIRCGLDSLRKRIALNPERGIAMEAGQSLEDLYRERKELYERYSDFVCDSELLRPDECASFIMGKTKGLEKKKGRYFHD